MTISHTPRPCFFLRQTIERLGGRSSTEAFARSGNADLDTLVPSGAVAAAWWNALEPLAFVLTLAGYECTEIVIAKSDRETGYLRLLCWEGLVEGNGGRLVATGAGKWTELTGAELDSSLYARIFLRAKVRRHLGQPLNWASQHPPVALDGLTGNGTFVHPVEQGPEDDFADEGDGWIAFYHPAVGADAPERMPATIASEARRVRDAVVERLVAEWQQVPQQAGILRFLDPSYWESPLDRALPDTAFETVAQKIWDRAATATELTRLLTLKLDDRTVSLGHLDDAWRANQSHESLKEMPSLGDAIASLDVRREAMWPDEATLDPILAGLRHTHWVLALLLLHEYGLIEIVPFPLFAGPTIPLTDLTGWYESTGTESTGRPVNAAMQLTHAFDHVSGWWQDDQLVIWELAATLDVTSYDPEHPDEGTEPLRYTATFTGPEDSRLGTIDLIPRGNPDDIEIRVNFAGASHMFVRRHRLSSLRPSTLVAAIGDDAPDGLAQQIVPLHSHAEGAIAEAVEQLAADVEEMKGLLGGQWSVKLDAAETAFREFLDDQGVLRFTSANEPEQTDMLRRFRATVLSMLSSIPIQRAGCADALFELSDILAFLAAGSPLPSVGRLTRLLGLELTPHEYTFAMAEIGADIDITALPTPLGVLGGHAGAGMHLTFIDHTQCDPEGPVALPHRPWAAFYLGSLAQVGVSGATEVHGQANLLTVSTPNDLWSDRQWLSGDFAPCVWIIGEATGHGSWFPGIVGGRFGPGIMAGPEWEAYAFLAQRGLAVGWGDGVFASLGAGLSAGPIPLGFGFGYGAGVKVGSLHFEIASAVPPPVPPPDPLTLEVDASLTVSFDFDVSALRPEAVVQIARNVARYRALFESPDAHILIEGDASEEGSDEYNEKLSYERALSVYGCVRGILAIDGSHALAPGLHRVEIAANGEAEARLAATAGPINPETWRRAKLVINDHVMVVL